MVGDTMEFKPLTINEHELFNKYKHSSSFCCNYLGSELNYQNLMTWKVADKIEYAVIDDVTMIIKGQNRGISYFFPPMSQSEKDFINAILAMEKCASAHNIPFLIKGLSEEMVALIRESGLKYRIDEERDYFEYLYDPEGLRTLSGKKYHKKRNLLNQFLKNVKYDFKAYEPGDEELIRDLLIRWENKKSHAFEHQAIFDALAHLDKLNCFCDIILIDGVAHAFSIGTIADNMGLVLFEKADTSYTGIYQAINYLFVNRHFSDVNVINRQEDLGILELRKAKLSYNPVGFVKKYSLMRNHLTLNEVNELKVLYQEAFDDSEGYLNYFFGQKYRAENVIFVKKEQKIISALHLVRKNLSVMETIYPLPFVVAAATLKKYRNQGYMKQVLKQTFSELYNRKYPLCALSPFDESFYNPYGFETIVRTKNREIMLTDDALYQKHIATKDDTERLITLYQTYMKNKNIYIERKISDWENLFNEVESDSGSIVILTYEGNDVGYYTLFGNVIEELCLLKNDYVPNYPEFTSGIIDELNCDNGISRLMIRIVNTKKFLEQYPFDESITKKYRIKIKDDFFQANDVTIELSINQGMVSIRDIEVYDSFITVNELADWAFNQGKYPFNQPMTIIFDRY